jgi:hypothetical protein
MRLPRDISATLNGLGQPFQVRNSLPYWIWMQKKALALGNWFMIRRRAVHKKSLAD